jgi:hypothetical protein
LRLRRRRRRRRRSAVEGKEGKGVVHSSLSD